MTYSQPLTLLRALIAEAEGCFGKRSQHLYINPAWIKIQRAGAIAFDLIEAQQIVELDASEDLAGRLCSAG